MRFCRPTSNRTSAHRVLETSTTRNTVSSGCKSGSSDRPALDAMTRWSAGAAALVMIVWAFAVSMAASNPEVAALERAVSADPENLRLAAEYRQQNIRAGDF